MAWKEAHWSSADRSQYQNSVLDAHPDAAGNEVYATLVAEQPRWLGVVPSQAQVDQ